MRSCHDCLAETERKYSIESLNHPERLDVSIPIPALTTWTLPSSSIVPPFIDNDSPFITLPVPLWSQAGRFDLTAEDSGGMVDREIGDVGKIGVSAMLAEMAIEVSRGLWGTCKDSWLSNEAFTFNFAGEARLPVIAEGGTGDLGASTGIPASDNAGGTMAESGWQPEGFPWPFSMFSSCTSLPDDKGPLSMLCAGLCIRYVKSWFANDDTCTHCSWLFLVEHRNGPWSFPSSFFFFSLFFRSGFGGVNPISGNSPPYCAQNCASTLFTKTLFCAMLAALTISYWDNSWIVCSELCFPLFGCSLSDSDLSLSDSSVGLSACKSGFGVPRFKLGVSACSSQTFCATRSSIW